MAQRLIDVGRKVRARIASRERRRVTVEVVGQEDVSASSTARSSTARRARRERFPTTIPRLAAVVDAVVQEIDRSRPSLWIRLTLRDADHRRFAWPRVFCTQPGRAQPRAETAPRCTRQARTAP